MFDRAKPREKVVLRRYRYVQIVCKGNGEGDLQERVAAVLRTDPRTDREIGFGDLLALPA